MGRLGAVKGADHGGFGGSRGGVAWRVIMVCAVPVGGFGGGRWGAAGSPGAAVGGLVDSPHAARNQALAMAVRMEDGLDNRCDDMATSKARRSA